MSWSEFGSLLYRAKTRRADYAPFLSCLNVYFSLFIIMFKKNKRSLSRVCVSSVFSLRYYLQGNESQVPKIPNGGITLDGCRGKKCDISCF